MAAFRVITFVAVLLAWAIAVEPAFACPAGYQNCGGACCPR